MAQDETDRVDTWLDLPPSVRQTRWALAVTAIVLVGFVRGHSDRPPADGRAQRILSLARRHRVRQRSGHGGPPLRAVFDLPLARAAGAGNRISLHGVDRHSACADLRGRVHGHRTAGSEHPDRIMAFHLLAHRLCGSAARLCVAAGGANHGACLQHADAARDRMERCRRHRAGVRSDLALDRGRDAAAADHPGPAPHQPDRGLSDFVRDPDFARRAAVCCCAAAARCSTCGLRWWRWPQSSSWRSAA